MKVDGDQPLEQTSRTETTVRQFDTAGRLISETTTVVTRAEPANADELPVGMYL